jgi:hypothetical protein
VADQDTSLTPSSRIDCPSLFNRPSRGLPAEQFEALKAAEESERGFLISLVREASKVVRR